MIAPSPAGRMSATVTNPQALHRMVAAVSNPAAPAPKLPATVSRSRIDSWEADAVYYRFRVKLDGEWVPQSELRGPLEISEPEMGGHTGEFSFGLIGKRWSVAVTEKVWARVPVAIYLDHGQAGRVIEGEGTAVYEEAVYETGVYAGETPAYKGYVLARPRQDPGHEPIVRVTCGDEAAAYERYELCDELAPKSGLTRGQVMALLAAGAGLGYDGPDGAVYDKPLQAARQRLFDVLTEFAEPEGWQIEVKDGKVKVWNPKIKLAPLPPDWEWGPDDAGILEVVPVAPEESPSRWVLTATATVDTNEAGITTEVTRIKVEEEYAYQVAEKKIDVSGAESPTGLSQPPAELRPISLVILTEVKRGDLVLESRQEEWGYHYRRKARLVTNTGGAGTAGGGFDFLSAYVMPDGGYSMEAQERFRRIGFRSIRNKYDSSGTRLGSTIRTDKYQRGGISGIRAGASDPDATTIVGAYVYDDDQSYAQDFETWGEVETVNEVAIRNAKGWVASTVQESFRRQPIGARIDSGAYYQRYDGRGQTELVANRKRAQRVRTDKALTSDGLVAGETVTTLEYTHGTKTDGVYDWGDHKSNYEEETFRVKSAGAKLYKSQGERQVSQETYPDEGGREVNLILGGLPITEYTKSIWTRISAQPIELVVEDPLAEAWFGWQRQTLMHDYVQNLREARVVIRQLRRRALSPKADVARRDNGMVQRGHTVLLRWPSAGIEGRYIITTKGRTWGGAENPGAVANYRLEAWGDVA